MLKFYQHNFFLEHIGCVRITFSCQTINTPFTQEYYKRIPQETISIGIQITNHNIGVDPDPQNKLLRFVHVCTYVFI